MLAVWAVLASVPVRAEGVEEAVGKIDFSSWQQAVDESQGRLDVASTVRALAEGTQVNPQEIVDFLKDMLWGEARALTGRLIGLMAPALLWAVNRQLGSRLGAASGLICYLAGAGAMLTLFGEQLELTARTLTAVGRLTGQVFPVLTGLMSATGRSATASLMQPLSVFAGGALIEAADRIGRTLGGCAAVLAVAGNLSERISLNGLHKLCCSLGGWLLGGIMTIFLGLCALCGGMGGARDGLSVRAAKYAADNLLPVVGGDVADAMDAMAGSALLVRHAAGLTGAIALVAVCLRPLIRLGAGVLTFRLAAALVEPVADGAMKRSLDQIGQAAQVLLVAVAVSMSVFVTLIGVAMGGGA